MTGESAQHGEAVYRPKCWLVGHRWATYGTHEDSKWCNRCGKEVPFWYRGSQVIGLWAIPFIVIGLFLWRGLRRLIDLAR